MDVLDSKENFPVLTTKDRGEAVRNAYNFLQELPWRRGFAVYKSSELINGLKKHYSLFDMVSFREDRKQHPLPREKPDHVELKKRLQEENSALLPGTEKKPPKFLPTEKIKAISDVKVAESLLSGTLNIRDLDLVFSPQYGSVLFSAELGMRDSVFSKFYKPERYLGNPDMKNDLIDLRGLNYMVAIDNKYNLDGKMMVMEKDLLDGLEHVQFALKNRENIDNPRDFLLYLGILDYMKMHASSLFHTLTFSERECSMPSDPGDASRPDPEYLSFRNKSQKMMETFTRMYYQTLLGLDYDKEPDFSDLQGSIKSIVNYTKIITLNQVGEEKKDSLNFKQKSNMRFRYPESFSSPLFALSAQNAVSKYPEVDTIVGVPTGGTELAVVTQLAYEVLSEDRSVKNTPQVIYLPVSIHSKNPKMNPENLDRFVKHFYPDDFKDKNILLVDDNSASGKTLLLASDVIARSGAKKIRTFVGDFDPRRLLRQEKGDYYAGSSVFDATLGIEKIGDSGEEISKDYLKRKLILCRDQIKMEKVRKGKIKGLTWVLNRVMQQKVNAGERPIGQENQMPV